METGLTMEGTVREQPFGTEMRSQPEGADTTGEQTHHVRAWYGLPAEIAVENNLWHLVRVGGVALNHPPLVNLVLRRGQPRRERLYLSFLHEFGHLQTLPVAVIHALWLLANGRWRGRGFWGTLAALVAHQAVWEMASEAYVAGKAGREYGRYRLLLPPYFSGLCVGHLACSGVGHMALGNGRIKDYSEGK